MATAVDDARRFRSAFEMTSDGPEVFERLLSLLATRPVAGRQVHDANLVAAMLEHGISRLLTFNAGDFQRFAGTIEVVELVRS
jgi:predicted nucleic acid-binding protein